MATESPVTDTLQLKLSKRGERANRILDAAVTLIMRWGYNKTTIDDIARQAGVAKGTIYLHWKTREDLFGALLRREGLKLLDDLRQRLADNPTDSMLRGMLKHSALALMNNPLMKAVLLGDMDVLGKLVQTPQNRALYVEKLTGFETYLQFLRERDLVRDDLSLQQEVYMATAIFMGFFLVAPILSADLSLSDGELAELMAETVHRTLEPSRTVSPTEMQVASNAFGEYLNHFAAFMREQLQQELES